MATAKSEAQLPSLIPNPLPISPTRERKQPRYFSAEERPLNNVVFVDEVGNVRPEYRDRPLAPIPFGWRLLDVLIVMLKAGLVIIGVEYSIGFPLFSILAVVQDADAVCSKPQRVFVLSSAALVLLSTIPFAMFLSTRRRRWRTKVPPPLGVLRLCLVASLALLAWSVPGLVWLLAEATCADSWLYTVAIVDTAFLAVHGIVLTLFFARRLHAFTAVASQRLAAGLTEDDYDWEYY